MKKTAFLDQSPIMQGKKKSNYYMKRVLDLREVDYQNYKKNESLK